MQIVVVVVDESVLVYIEMNTISIVTRDVQQFLKSPLILWAESFLSNDQKITYEQLINSSCFHTIIRSM